MSTTKAEVRFETGPIFLTPGAKEALQGSGEHPAKFVAMHQALEMGELSFADYQENLLSVKEGFRIFSAYRTSAGEKLWVITEADRSSTTVLLPSEY